jgi:hypothetical protein
MEAASWQAHSVRGFISGTLGKKMGLTVKSEKRDDGSAPLRASDRIREFNCGRHAIEFGGLHAGARCRGWKPASFPVRPIVSDHGHAPRDRPRRILALGSVSPANSLPDSFLRFKATLARSRAYDSPKTGLGELFFEQLFYEVRKAFPSVTHNPHVCRRIVLLAIRRQTV